MAGATRARQHHAPDGNQHVHPSTQHRDILETARTPVRHFLRPPSLTSSMTSWYFAMVRSPIFPATGPSVRRGVWRFGATTAAGTVSIKLDRRPADHLGS